MNRKEYENYEAPRLEVIEVQVEKGFATSAGDDMPYEDWIGA